MMIDLDRKLIVVASGPSIEPRSLRELLARGVIAIGDDPLELAAHCEQLMDARHRELLDGVVDSHLRDLQTVRDKFKELALAIERSPKEGT